jgi:transglutaminase-like putative cysteine protease
MERRDALVLTSVAVLVAVLACNDPQPDAATVPPSPTLVSPTLTPTPFPTQIPPTATSSPTPSPTPAPTPTPTIVYRPAFDIDYAHPEQYLAQGEQSQISDPTVLDSLRADEQSLTHLRDIYRWLKREFEAYRAGGKTIGVVTVDQLLAERRLGGCHDYGLVYAAVARELGYPAVMMHTVSIAWVEGFQAGEEGSYVGHVFVEVFLNGRWVLVDSTNGWYLEDGYDPTDPVIPLKGRIAGASEEHFGFYVEVKGIDIWAFGVHSLADTTRGMEDLANRLDLTTIVYPDYEFQHFSK